MNLLDRAIALACKTHAGQVDKADQPYILHPLRLMLKFHEEDARIVSVLHDVVEDGDVTLSDLESMGFQRAVLNAIECLTKKEKESYEDFILRVSHNELARKVKIEDIKDNLNLTRLTELNEKDCLRAMKYHKALRFLLAKNR